MTLPVPVLEGADILLTRRTIERRLLLSPNPVVNEIIKFTLALAASRHGILLYAKSALSNHHHTVLHDPYACYPEFAREYHSLVARSVNCHRGRSEAFWSPGRQSAVILKDREALLDKIAYTIGNPATSDLVEGPEDWPGVISRIEDLAGPPQVVKRPSLFFDPNGSVPEFVELRYVKPSRCSDLSAEEYQLEIASRVADNCRVRRRIRSHRGTGVLGRIGVLRQDPNATPRSRAPFRRLRPLVACAQRTLRIATLAWIRWFRRCHRKARLIFEGGDQSAGFPYGTYLHRRRYGVDCSTAGPP